LVVRIIEETGNVEVFRRLGFEVTDRAVSIGYVSPDGGPVVQVEMVRTTD
jgi:hypothetical protein